MRLQERHIWSLLAGLLLVSFFVHIHVPPLSMEEPRRALVPLEMYLSGDWIVQTNYGHPYCSKGPLFHWVQLGMSYLFGEFSHFSMRLVSILSHLILGLCIWLLGRSYLGERAAWIASLGYLVSVDIYFYFSMLGEMDLFYSLLSFLLFMSPYHYWKRGRQYLSYLMPWVLASLGVLVKGVPSVLFLGLTLVGFHLLYLRSWRSLWNWRQFVGAALGAVLVGSYIWVYSLSSSLDCWLDLWTQSSERTLWGKDSSFWKWSSISFLWNFPLEFVKNTLPLSPILFLLWGKKDFRQKLWSNDFLRYLFIVFAINIVAYWFSPGTRSRYVYMFFPIVLLWISAIWEGRNFIGMRRFYRIVVLVASLLFLGGAVLPWLEVLDFVPGRFWIAIYCVASSAMIFGLWHRKRWHVLPLVFLCLILGRIAFGLTVLPARKLAPDSVSNQRIVDALEVVERSTGKELYVYADSHFSLGVGFYITRARQEILWRKEGIRQGAYYIVDENYLDRFGGKPEYQIEYEGLCSYLLWEPD